MVEQVKNVNRGRVTKGVASVVVCIGAYAGALSLSAHDLRGAFHSNRAEAPAIAALSQPAARSTMLAQSVPSAMKATIASAR